jgi:antitoxin HicB
MQRYTVVLTPEQDGSAYNVTIPALPGCFTWGATVEEALAMAREAVMLYLQGEDDPPPPDADVAIVASVSIDEPAPAPV